MSNYEFWNELGNIFDAVLAYQKKNIEFNKTFITPWVRLGHVFPQEDASQKDLQAILHAAELNPEDPLIWADLGDVFHKTGNFEEAVEAYGKAIELDPVAAWPKSNLALTLEAQGKYQEAILLYRESLEGFLDDRNKAIIWNRLGNSYRKLGDFENAVGAFLRADELDAKISCFRDSMIESREVDSEEGCPQEAPETGAEAVMQDSTFELHSPESTATEELQEGQSLSMQSPSDSKESIFLEQSTGKGIPNSADSEPELNLAMKMGSGLNLVAEGMEDLDLPEGGVDEYPLQDSISNPETIEEIPSDSVGLPSFTEPASLTAETERNLKVMNDSNVGLSAVDFVKQNDRNQPEPDELMINRIAYEEYLKDFVEPVQLTEEELAGQTPQSNAVPSTTESDLDRIQFDTQNEQVWNELGNVYFNSGSYDDAIMAYRQALELDPKFAWAYSNLALVYVQKGRFDEAILLYKHSIELFKNDKDKASTWNRLGNLYRRQQDYDNAILAYQTADELDPENISLLLRSRFSLLGNLLEEQPAYSS